MDNQLLQELKRSIEENTLSLKSLQVKVEKLELTSLTADQVAIIVSDMESNKFKAKLWDYVVQGAKGVLFISAFVAASAYLYEFFRGLKD